MPEESEDQTVQVAALLWQAAARPLCFVRPMAVRGWVFSIGPDGAPFGIKLRAAAQ